MEELVAVIFVLCTKSGMTEEKTIKCFEDYTNCMVKEGGKIDLKDIEKCTEEVKRGKKYSE